MSSTAAIKHTLDRNAQALQLRPAIGRNTAVTKVKLGEGLACEVEEGAWKLKVDMSPKSGGAGSAPNPGIYGRASLGSCLAIGYAMWAARMEVPIRSLEVEVQADFDTRAEYGIDGGRPSYEQVRCIVTVESDAPVADVRRVIEQANAGSSYLHVWRDPQNVILDIRVQGAAS
jgi:uncharacterized OsmC-like protein